MRHSIMTAITEQNMKFDEYFQRALDEACSPARVQDLMNFEVRKQLDDIIKQEVKTFFQYGEGRKTVREAVIEQLMKDWRYEDELMEDFNADTDT